MKSKVVLGLSGGVDSSLAAYILKEQGFEVTGIYLKSELSRDESAEACEAAKNCGVDFRVEDITQELKEKVCEYFVSEYCSGRTPSPCIRCNPSVKFKTLLKVADGIGAEFVATGHYADIVRLPSGELAVGTGRGRNDQSYMLCRLESSIYPRLRFPIGGFTKAQVRELAAARGIPSAQKPDSMEICFIPDNNRIGFIENWRGGTEGLSGSFVDGDGKILSPHAGIHRYTVGQRKGLGIALGYPAYVSDIDPESGNVTLMPSGGEYSTEISVSDCLWHIRTDECFEADVRVRHSAEFTRGIVRKLENGAVVTFPNGVRAAAPGQSAVFYVAGAIAGCGTIEKRAKTGEDSI